MDEKQIALLESLINRTEQGRINWQKTAEPALFLATIGGYNVSVSESRPTPDFGLSNGLYYAVEITDDEGDTVDVISGFTVADSSSPTFSVTTDESRIHKLLARLHELARRHAHNADKAIDEILGVLNSST